MYKKISLLVLFILIFSINVYSAKTTEAYKWLDSQKPVDVYSAAVGALALKEVNGGKNYFDLLNSKKSTTFCWPSIGCKARETALSLLALKDENIDQGLEWLKNNQKTSLTGDWILQIKTDNSGDCNINYKNTTKKITVEKGNIKSDICQNPTVSFNLGKCLENNLLSKPPVELEIKCNFDGEISSAYIDSPGVYYLNDDVIVGSEATIRINNGNFDTYEDTLFVNWALKTLNYEQINSLIYLKKNYKSTDVKSNAFLYLITNKQSYVNDLSALQKSDGSFGDIIDTAIALLALDDNQHQSQLDLGKRWLDTKQEKDGSWNKNILDTSFVLYAVYPDKTLDLGYRGIDQRSSTDKEETSPCNKDSICDLGETALECKDDCSCGDNKCDNSENSISCPKDCEEVEETQEESKCGNDIIDGNEECDGILDEACPGKCEECKCKEEKSGFMTFLKYFMVILILIVLVFFVYKKFGNEIISKFKKKPVERSRFIMPQEPVKKSEFKGPLNLLKPISKVDNRKSKVEEELERSLKEAKKLLEK